MTLALFTDLYQLTMAYGFFLEGIENKEAIFHLSFRKRPFAGNFAVAAGLETAIEFVKNFHYDDSDIEYLRSLSIFSEAFLSYLKGLKLTCDIDAVEEGTPVLTYQPLLRVKGPLLQAQILESPLLNIINFQTLIATKAARVVFAAGGDPVVEFGMRRAQGFDGAISASRAAYIGGVESTSHLLAGKLFGIPVRGTQAHSFIMAFKDEKEAFGSFSRVMPKGCVLLVDTYDSIEGVKNAISVFKEKGDFELLGVRLDSGDLAKLSIKIRIILDKAGLKKTKIMASNELDEYLIRDLKQQGAKIDIWGVGTNLVTSKDQSALDGVYKLSAIKNRGVWENRIKLSSSKVTIPGILQTRRYFDGKNYTLDALFDEKSTTFKNTIVDIFDPNLRKKVSPLWKKENLLKPIFRQGQLKYKQPSLVDIRKKAIKELSRMPSEMRRFLNPEPYFAGMEKSLYDEWSTLIQKLRDRVSTHK